MTTQPGTFSPREMREYDPRNFKLAHSEGSAGHEIRVDDLFLEVQPETQRSGDPADQVRSKAFYLLNLWMSQTHTQTDFNVKKGGRRLTGLSATSATHTVIEAGKTTDTDMSPLTLSISFLHPDRASVEADSFALLAHLKDYLQHNKMDIFQTTVKTG